jgi:hypothetical protein
MKKTTIRIIIWDDVIGGQIDNIWEFQMDYTKDGKFPSCIQSCFNDAITNLEMGKKISIELVE